MKKLSLWLLIGGMVVALSACSEAGIWPDVGHGCKAKDNQQDEVEVNSQESKGIKQVLKPGHSFRKKPGRSKFSDI